MIYRKGLTYRTISEDHVNTWVYRMTLVSAIWKLRISAHYNNEDETLKYLLRHYNTKIWEYVVFNYITNNYEVPKNFNPITNNWKHIITRIKSLKTYQDFVI